MQEEKLELFKTEMNTIFENYISKRPKSEGTIQSSLDSIEWLDATLKDINISIPELINKHAQYNVDLKDTMQNIAVQKTKSEII